MTTIDFDSIDLPRNEELTGALSRNPLFAHLDEQDELLTPEEELMLARRVRTGCRASRNELIERNLRLVVDLARRSAPPSGHDLLDRIQAGAIGLTRAVDLFDPERGFRLTSYATPAIRQAITRTRETSDVVSVPAEPSRQLRAVERALQREHGGREPSDQQIAVELEMDPAHVAAMRVALQPLSLDAPLTSDGNSSYVDYVADSGVADPAEIIEECALRHEAVEHLRQLEPTERAVVALRHGLVTGTSETIASVARRTDLTERDVRILLDRAMRTLQARAEGQPIAATSRLDHTIRPPEAVQLGPRLLNRTPRTVGVAVA